MIKWENISKKYIDVISLTLLVSDSKIKYKSNFNSVFKTAGMSKKQTNLRGKNSAKIRTKD